MTTATTRRGMRRTRLLAAITAGILLVTAPLFGAMAATADETGYVGASDDAGEFDSNGGSRTLGVMTAGEGYTSTLFGPQYGEGTSWCWSWSGTVPTGITMSTTDDACAPMATFSGTPQAGDYAFVVVLTRDIGDGASETYSLLFDFTVEAAKSPTTTTLTAPAVGAYSGVPLSATVAGNPSVGHAPTGTVEFYISGDSLIGSGELVDGVATATGVIDISNVGYTYAITAKYLGDDDYQPSTSTHRAVDVFAPTAVGTVVWNGGDVAGATVALLDGTDPTIVVDTDTTDADGAFEVSPGAITSTTDVDKLYLLRVTLADSTVLFHAFGGWNVTDVAAAELSGPNTWGRTIKIERRTAPEWTDSTLATPRIGENYSDAVAAASQNTVTYTVSAGTIPDGLTLNASGTVTGIAEDCAATPFPFSTYGATAGGCDYDFTITASNGYGSVTQQFTGTLLPAGVAPTWDDDEIIGLRAGVAVTEAVLAVGDPTITYAVTAGALPAGVTLWPATGALSGTPTTAGEYEFTITATNEFGSVDAVFEGEVAAAPAIDLTLDFAPGTSIDDAASTISADGLQVGSTYTLTMFSTPRVLYTGAVGGTGGFSWVVSLPADTPAGSHRLLLTGIAADGTPMSAQAWFSLLPDGTIGAVSYTGPVGGLAATGAEPGSAALAGGLLLVLGVAVLTLRRRRAA